jgi:GntP family gluconate:H+ symporter
MSAVTASTTAGATLASASFSDVILGAGISAVWVAALINSGATILDHLPHGSFFHATAGSVEMNLKERLKLIGYESLIGCVLAVAGYVCHFFIRA